MIDPLDLENFTLSPGQLARPRAKLGRTRRAKPAGRFLRGPLCWDWLTAAGRLRGAALHVALVAQFLAGLNKSQTVALSGMELARIGIPRTTGYRALRALERAGLVAVCRRSGRLPRVTVIEIARPGSASSLSGPPSAHQSEEMPLGVNSAKAKQ